MAAAEAAGSGGGASSYARGSWAGPLASVRLLIARGSSRSSSVNLGEVIRHVPPYLLKV